ncbi:helix-turn-helix transcriptional regulator [Parapedobacter defluvii]|nr:helix-turn-helix transcriptional regulator [Parapedobacter defluvii]
MHIVTFTFILLESAMFFLQLALYLIRPSDRHRRWYLILLFLLILYNTTGGLFPDPDINLPVHVQNIIAYGTGFLTAAYFPYYFYRAFGLKLLRFHALYGVPLFLLLPYLLFFVIGYAMHQDLEYAIRYGVVVPFFYSLVLLWAILRAIRAAYRENRNGKRYTEEIMVYIAVAPWSAMTLIAYFDLGQLTEALFTNLGFLAITALFILKSVRRARKDYELLINLPTDGVGIAIFEENCRYYGLTKTEVGVSRFLCRGLRNKEIAAELFISPLTVKKHVENIYRKTGAGSRASLIHILSKPPIH